jgi:hypothetical protein
VNEHTASATKEGHDAFMEAAGRLAGLQQATGAALDLVQKLQAEEHAAQVSR